MGIFKHQRIKYSNPIKSQYRLGADLSKTLLKFLNITALTKLNSLRKGCMKTLCLTGEGKQKKRRKI